MIQEIVGKGIEESKENRLGWNQGFTKDTVIVVFPRCQIIKGHETQLGK